jgi:hypothetical protein
MYSTYMTDYMVAIMREINSLYDVDGMFMNGWPPLGSLPVCYCDVCRKLPRSGTVEYWEKFNERCVSLWKLYDGIAKEKNPRGFYFANLGGGIRSSLNLKELGNLCDWFQGDNQGRGGDETPIWACASQGRVCRAAIPLGKMAANVTGAWSTGSPRWRNVHKSPAEQRMWLDETVASGMVPYHHIIGGETGLGEDRRLLEPTRQYFNWHARNERHYINKRSIANIGVVMGQRSQLFYNAPRGAGAGQYMDGMYYALLEGRNLFDFIHEENLTPENLKPYSALLLPNIALLSDQQCAQLRAYVAGGGSLLATFETSLYTERNQKRADFGLADVFGIHKAGEVVAPAGGSANPYLARIERKHPVLEGFAGTNLLPGAEYRVPLAPVENPALTVVPGYVAYPPELSYPTEPHTNEPAIILREQGKSRLVYFPGDVDRTMIRSGHTDLSRLLRNAIGWVAGGGAPVTVRGKGVIETFAWETEAGFAVHVLNYTNPNMHRGWVREFYPIGPQTVRFKLPAGRRVTRVELLCAAADVKFTLVNGVVEFAIPSVADYEVAALHA